MLPTKSKSLIIKTQEFDTSRFHERPNVSMPWASSRTTEAERPKVKIFRRTTSAHSRLSHHFLFLPPQDRRLIPKTLEWLFYSFYVNEIFFWNFMKWKDWNWFIRQSLHESRVHFNSEIPKTLEWLSYSCCFLCMTPRVWIHSTSQYCQ